MSTNDLTGTKIGAWEILNVDGRACLCRCACSGTRAIATAALVDGSAAPSCGCAPLSPGQAAQQRTEAAQQRLRRDLKGWRPQT
jgi:hypothetical protein